MTGTTSQIDLDAIFLEAIKAYREFDVVHFNEPWYIDALNEYMVVYHD